MFWILEYHEINELYKLIIIKEKKVQIDFENI